MVTCPWVFRQSCLLVGGGLFGDCRNGSGLFGSGRSDRLFDGILQQAPEGTHAVFPSDLLALFVGTAPITDSHLVDSQPSFGDLDRDLRLEPEAVFLQA